MPKFVEYSEWQTPWAKAGEDLDEAKVSRLIYNLQKSEHEQAGKISALAADKLAAETALTEKAREGETAEQAKDRKIAELEARVAESGQTSLETLRLRVAIEKGLTTKQAARLVGTTEEELASDADAYLADLGPAKKAGEEQEDDDSDYTFVGRERPTSTVKPGGKVREPEAPFKAADYLPPRQ